MNDYNPYFNRRCSKCNKHACCCKKVCTVPGVSIGPLRATVPGVTPIVPAAICGLCEYGYIYNLSPQVVPLETDILFDSTGVTTSGITHIPGTAQILVTNPGDYEVTFYLTSLEPNQFTLFLNGTPVPGTTYGTGAGTQANFGQAIISLTSGDSLTLRNHTSAAAVTLQTLAGGTQTNVNASIVIKLLGSTG